ncbi:MAG: hypothetical protein WBW73_08210 [Rhodoplanes sp.]
MGAKELHKVLERIATWPEAAQEEALHSLQTIEEDFVVDAALARDLERADKEIERREGTPQEEVFERYGL